MLDVRGNALWVEEAGTASTAGAGSRSRFLMPTPEPE
jgi:hypothetical protein